MSNENNISEHAWSQEQIAAYITGGMSSAEMERLEAHARECPECESAIQSYRRLDVGLNSLFAPGRPGIGLEDRLLFTLRMGPERKPAREGWQNRLLIAATAAVVLTAGGVVSSYIDKLPTPEKLINWSFAKQKDEKEEPYRHAFGLPEGLVRELKDRPVDNVTSEDLGLRSDFDPALGDVKQALQRANVDLTLKELDSIRERNLQIPQGQQFQITRDTLWIDDDSKNSNGFLDRETVRGTSRFTNNTGVEGFSFNRAVPSSSSETNNGSANLTNLKRNLILNHPSLTNNTNTYYSNNANLYGESVPVNGRTENLAEANPATIKVIAQTEDKSRGEVAWSFRPGDHKPTEAKPALEMPVNGNKIVGKPTVEGLEVTAQRVIKNQISEAAAAVPTQSPAPKAVPDAAPRNVVIRSGEIEFEVDSFDSAAATVTKLVVGIKGAFVATTNSEKLTNGKVKGSITVRVPPDQLDGLLLDLRREISKSGELKGSRIGSQDITKQYTDLESRLKAAKIMEERLQQIIKEGKGEIKILLEAEKELGVWRTKIEEFEGELRFYANQVALSTLTITLTEKEIKAAAGLTESERIQAGMEVEEVDKAYQQLMAAVVEAKGRVTKSEVKQLTAGQFNATLNFELAPEAAGAMRDRLRQLGRVARLEIDRVQEPEGVISKTAKIQRGDAKFLVQLYNLANIAPREVAIIQVAVPDVPAAYRTLRDVAVKSSGRVMTAQLNEQDRQNVAAQFDFEVRRSDEGGYRSAIDTLGEVVTRQVTRAPENENVTDAKVLYRTQIIAANQLKPRERVILALEVANVDNTVLVFKAEVNEAKGRQVDSQFVRERSGKRTAKLVYEVPLAEASGLVEHFKSAGAVSVFQSNRDPLIPESKYATSRLEITLTSGERIIGEDDGVWPKVERGLSYSVTVLLTSITWLVFGLCVVLPWVIISYFGFRMLRWLLLSKKSAPNPVPPTATT